MKVKPMGAESLLKVLVKAQTKVEPSEAESPPMASAKARTEAGSPPKLSGEEALPSVVMLNRWPD